MCEPVAALQIITPLVSKQCSPRTLISFSVLLKKRALYKAEEGKQPYTLNFCAFIWVTMSFHAQQYSDVNPVGVIFYKDSAI